MALNIHIEFKTQDREVLNRIWLFGEELSLAFRDGDLASLPMDEVDAVTTFLCVRLKSKRKAKRTQEIITDMLVKHNLLDITDVAPVRSE